MRITRAKHCSTLAASKAKDNRGYDLMFCNFYLHVLPV